MVSVDEEIVIFLAIAGLFSCVIAECGPDGRDGVLAPNGVCYWRTQTGSYVNVAWSAFTCMNEGGSPAMFEDEDIFTWYRDTVGFPDDNFFVGAYFFRHDLTFRWMNGAALNSWATWRNDEPSRYQNGVRVFETGELASEPLSWIDPAYWFRALCQTRSDFLHSCPGDCLESYQGRWNQNLFCSSALMYTFSGVTSLRECRAHCGRSVLGVCGSYIYDTDTENCNTYYDEGEYDAACSTDGDTKISENRVEINSDPSCRTWSYVSEGASFTDAVSTCSQTGGHLVMIKTKADLDRLSQLTLGGVWLGMNDSLGGRYKYIDGTSPSIHSIYNAYPYECLCYHGSSNDIYSGSCDYPASFMCATLTDLTLCDSAPDLHEATKEVFSEYGMVTYTCTSGRNFADGLYVKHVYCPCDGDWSGAIGIVGHCYDEVTESACMSMPCLNGGECVTTDAAAGLFVCSCLPGFTGDHCEEAVDKYCFEGVCYWKEGQLLNYHEAFHDCFTKDGSLASFPSSAVLEWFKSTEMANRISLAWIGLSNLHIPTVYRWTTGETLGYDNWDSFLTNDKSCVQLTSSGHFKPVSCSLTHPYICQSPAASNAIDALVNIPYTISESYVSSKCFTANSYIDEFINLTSYESCQSICDAYTLSQCMAIDYYPSNGRCILGTAEETTNCSLITPHILAVKSYTGRELECQTVSVDNTLRTWQDATEFCKASGGQIAKITSMEEGRRVSLAVQAALVNLNGESPVWIGLSDEVPGAYLNMDGSPCLNKRFSNSFVYGKCAYLLDYDVHTANCSELRGVACEMHECNNNGNCSVDIVNGGVICSCADGFSGTSCEPNDDSCASNPCQFGGTCSHSNGEIECACVGLYEGDLCGSSVKICAGDTCMNGGTCSKVGGVVSCACPTEYTGEVCDTQINDTTSGEAGACQNGVPGIGLVTCNCLPGFTGVLCESEIDGCASDPCYNDATCTTKNNGFECACSDGFSGTNCESEVSLCDPNPCLNLGNCTVVVSAYKCDCEAAFTGINCESDVGYCSDGVCVNGGSCLDGHDSFSCLCLPQHTGSRCQTSIDHCESGPCANGGSCAGSPSGFSCACAGGYTGVQCETNIDECSTTSCSNVGTCVDGIANFTCICPLDQTGLLCETQITECTYGICKNNGTCAVANSTLICSCTEGFTGSSCETDIDDCLMDPCFNGGTCQDGPDSFSCLCPQIYTGTTCETTVDSCDSDPCGNGGSCSDISGGHQCTCSDGFTGLRCETNIDDCLTAPCSNAGTCVDGEDSFLCICPLMFSGRLCETELTNCSADLCKNGGNCTDITNTLSCICAIGFTGDSCETDIDDYSYNVSEACATSACIYGTCVNSTIGAFSCACREGYTGERCESSIDIHQCASPPCAHHCTTNPCLHNGTCVEHNGEEMCLCHPGYKGQVCADLSNFEASCEALGPISNTGYESFGRQHGAYATYRCSQGHTFPEGGTSRTVHCVHGRWNSLPSPCIEIMCSENNLGAEMQLVCNQGEKHENGLGENAVKCMEFGGKGRWSSAGSCSGRRCLPFPLIDKADMTTQINMVGEETEVACDFGHRFPDGSKIKQYHCLSDQLWEEPFHTCKVEVCPPLAIPPNSTIDTTLAYFGVVVHYTCDQGYEMVDKSSTLSLECLDGAVWSKNISKCQPILCPAPEFVDNSVSSLNPIASVLPYNTVITYTCVDPTRLEYGYTQTAIRCGAGGSWNRTTISCKENRCPPLPEIAHGEPDTRLADSGTTSTYTCTTGYVSSLRPGQRMRMTCDGTNWQGDLGQCLVVECPMLSIGNGSVAQADRTYGSLATISCDPGYRIQGNLSLSVMCSDTSEWVPPETSCKPINCGEPPSLVNSKSTVHHTTLYQDTIMYSCVQDQWYRVGVFEQEVTCEADGTWAVTYTECYDVRCPALPVWDNLIVTTNDTGAGSQVFVECEDGHHLWETKDINTTTVTCQDDGTWSPQYPRCKEIDRPNFSTVPTESEESKIIVPGVFVAIGIISAIVFISDIPTYIIGINQISKNICPGRSSYYELS